MAGLQPFLILLIAFIAEGKDTPLSLSDLFPNESSWNVPNWYGEFILVTRETVERELDYMVKNTETVKYYLYTPKNPTKAQKIIPTKDGLQKSYFNASVPTRIIVHGFGVGPDDTLCILIRDAYLKTEPCNVVCVGWSYISHRTYVTARLFTPTIGENIAEFIESLATNGGMVMDDLILIGHSLGAQTSGFAAKGYAKRTGKLLKTLIGLDPAQTLFDYYSPANRISKDDATFVMSIQTDGDLLGYIQPIGKAAFFPNGGISQPGCNGDNHCSHVRAYMYFAESILYDNFPTSKCVSLYDGFYRVCKGLGPGVNMSVKNSFGKEGSFDVSVNSKSPFGMGPINSNA